MQQLKDKALSIEELLKVIPIDAESKEDIQKNYASWDIGKRAAITEMLWGSFAEFKDVTQNVAYELLLQQKYADDKYEGDMNLWTQAEDLAWKYIAELLAGKAEADKEIEHLRATLKNMHHV